MESEEMTRRHFLQKLAILDKVPSENVHLRVCGPKAVFYIVKEAAKVNSAAKREIVQAKLVNTKLDATPEIGLSAQSQV